MVATCRHKIFSWSLLCHNCGLAPSSDFKEPFIVSTLTTIVFFEGKRKTYSTKLTICYWLHIVATDSYNEIVQKLSWNFSRRQNDSLLGPTTGYADCEKKLWQQNVYTAFWIRVIFFQPCMPIRKVSFPSLFVATLQNSLQSFLTEQHDNILKWNV